MPPPVAAPPPPPVQRRCGVLSLAAGLGMEVSDSSMWKLSSASEATEPRDEADLFSGGRPVDGSAVMPSTSSSEELRSNSFTFSRELPRAAAEKNEVGAPRAGIDFGSP